MAEKISAVYKITNTVTGDFYIGSSKNVKNRWKEHKKPSSWKKSQNSPMYQDMKKYGKDKFELQILAEVEIEHLKEAEQQFIELLKPTYNNRRAKGWDIERYNQRHKEYQKDYKKSERYKECNKEYMKEYRKSERYKEYIKEYNNQLCYYNGKNITLDELFLLYKIA